MKQHGLIYIAGLFVLINALMFGLIVFGNISDYDTNWAFVEAVTNMQTANFGQAPGVGLDEDVMWHAVTQPWLQTIAYWVIIAAELLAAIVLFVALWRWMQLYRTLDAQSLAAAIAWSNMGLGLGAAIYGLGFIVIGGEWFQMWRSVAWNGLDSALRFFIVVSFALVFVNLAALHPVEQGFK